MFEYKNIVIILPERLGDALFHTPSIELIKRTYPDTNIDVIAMSPLSAMVVENNPNIREIFVEPSTSTLKKIAETHDYVMNVHHHSGTKQLAEAIGLPILVGERWPTAQHQSEHALSFMANRLGVKVNEDQKRYRLYPAEQNVQRIEAYLRDAGAVEGKDILIGCHIGCHSIAKRGWKFWKPLEHPKAWPLEKYVALEALLKQKSDRFRFVLTGSKSESILGEKFKKACPSAVDLINKTSVLDLAALMDKLTLFVTPDTGVLHVACAREVGVIALFGPTDLALTGPYPMQPNYRVLREDKLDAISVERVADAILTHPAVTEQLGGG